MLRTFRVFLCAAFLFLACALSAEAATVDATWNTATDVPVTASSYTATGNTVNLTLNFAPATGTNLTVVNNTGLPFISGTFSNLAHGQAVSLSYNGVNYPFMASYYGGTGNDLVLIWAGTRPVSWGYNVTGALGNNTTASSSVPGPMITAGTPLADTPLVSRTTLAFSAGYQHSLAVSSDGTVTSWGYNGYGQLGNNTYTNSSVPVAVAVTGTPLEGKMVVAVAGGYSHSLVLCSDGTVTGWGNNGDGQLGNVNGGYSPVPLAMTITGSALAGKTVVALGSGYDHALALCSDGTLATWGSNQYGQLGSIGSKKPVAVTGTAFLGKTVVSIAVGGYHSMALCSDGTIITWGNNGYGQLGNSTTSYPLAVETAGTALAGKTVIAIAAGAFHSLALCSDGTIAAWGINYQGQLGNNSTTNTAIPVAVSTTGALAGKTVVSLTAGSDYSLARCSDGTVVAWGSNASGRLGNNGTENSGVPVVVDTSSFAAGEGFAMAASGSSASHSLGLVATPNPTVTALAASSVASNTVVLNGAMQANGGAIYVSFDYGLDTSYGTNVAGAPASVTGASTTAVSAPLTGLRPNTTYHFRVKGTRGSINYISGDQTFTTLPGTLSGLALSTGTLLPAFSSAVNWYHAAVDATVSSIVLTPTASDSQSVVTVNGTTVASGSASMPIPLAYGDNAISVVVTAADNSSTEAFTLVVTRTGPVALAASYSSAADVPLTSYAFTATGNAVNFSLNYAPVAGTILTVVNNDAPGFISGTFSNLAQGQVVSLSYNGVAYPFVASYYGGTGNDLVLIWAGSRAVAWGRNSSGELGNSTIISTDGGSPTAVTTAGTPLAGRTLLALSAGAFHSLALCTDGTLSSWGANYAGQLGNNSASVNSSVPVAVTTAGTPLAGKGIVAISAGFEHNLVLCADGTLITWGNNDSGQLGNNTMTSSSVPVAVTTAGTVLAGKSVVAIGAGYNHNLVLCSDGTLATWGSNLEGALGNNTTTSSPVPEAVTIEGTPLAGKSVVSMSVGARHILVLCSDGTLVAWGDNSLGQLGNNSLTSSSLPVAVATAGTALEGKTVVAVAAGTGHSVALCSDGTLADWGGGYDGNWHSQSKIPMAVDASGVLAGKTVVTVLSGGRYVLVRCSDDTWAAWGFNTNGQLQDGTTNDRSAPVAVNTSSLAAGERYMRVAVGSCSEHGLALVASPFSTVTTLAATSVGTTTAVVNGIVNSNGGATTVSFDYGLDTSYGMTAYGIPTTVTGASPAAVSTTLTGLASNTTYHFRITGANGVNGATAYTGADQTFTTMDGNLSSLSLSSGSLSPAFIPTVYGYHAAVGAEVSSITLTPTLSSSQAAVAVNGAPVVSGSASSLVPLVYGDNTIQIVVTAADHLSTVTYVVLVTRAIPGQWSAAYSSAADVPVAFNGFSAIGHSVNLSLNYAPVPGTVLTVVKNTGVDFINGTFSNLAHGQIVNLSYNSIDYAFVVNYYGGTGNDLVLIWASTRLAGWGSNDYGQLGSTPSNILKGTPLAANIPLTLSVGAQHSLAVFADGSLAGWGSCDLGRLGNGLTYGLAEPVILNTASTPLAGKVIVAASAGGAHSLALCSDGTLAAWGAGYAGQLGNNSTSGSSVPGAVTTAGTPLAGKTVVAIGAGDSHSLALCSDGTLVAWGSNYSGQLGNGTTTASSVPVAVTTTGTPLAGKTVVAMAVGPNHNLVLCSDGTLAAWGDNLYGQLGSTTTSTNGSMVPVAVTTAGTVLAGKTVTAIATGDGHTLALCSDGTLAAWGQNADGELGNNTFASSSAPVAVDMSGVLAGKTVSGIAAGHSHSMAWCTDGTLAAWGAGNHGQLGTTTFDSKNVPVATNSTLRRMGEGFRLVVSGPGSDLTLGLISTASTDGSPPHGDAALSGLALSTGTLSDGMQNVPFDGATTSYLVMLDSSVTSMTITPTAHDNHATITVNDQSVASGADSSSLAIAPGVNLITAVVTAQDCVTQQTYMLTVASLSNAEKWRWQYFHVPYNVGAAADTVDIDNDGIPNLMEYALNLSPVTASKLPVTTAINGGNYEYTYTRSTAAVNAGTGFIVQWSSTLAAASWSSSGVVQTVLSDDGTTQQVKAVIPMNAASMMFVHLSVTAPPAGGF